MNNYNDIDLIMKGLSEQWAEERSRTQLTLGKLIAALEKLPADQPVTNLTNPHSYRGYYRDLAFEQGEGTQPAGQLLALCRGAMGQVFTGWKGGEFAMTALTPLWVAEHGCTGLRIMKLTKKGKVVTAAEDAD